MTADMHAWLSPYSIPALFPTRNMPSNMTRGTRATAANRIRLHQTLIRKVALMRCLHD